MMAMKKVLAFLGFLFLGVLIFRWAVADEIVLTAPISPSQLTHVRVSNISDHPDRSEMSIRMSIGYRDASGNWIEVRDDHEIIKNVPAIVDDPATPEDEARPAQPRYTNLKALIKTSGKSAERLILERVSGSRFKGAIQ